MKRLLVCTLFFIFCVNPYCHGQVTDAEALLDSTRKQLAGIASYEADARFEVDIDFVNMPPKDVRIRFEAPDKLDVDTDGFLLIPRVGLKPVVRQFDQDKFITLYLGEEMVNGINCHLIKLIPTSRNSRIILSTLWIGQEDFLIHRWESFTQKSGRMLIDLEYTDEILPSAMECTFEVSGMNIPLKYFGNEVEIDRGMMKDADGVEGRVMITFQNYRIAYTN